jgi:hypothetical protein
MPMIKGTKYIVPVQSEHRHFRKTNRVYAEKVALVRSMNGPIIPVNLPYNRHLARVLCYNLFRKGELIRISNNPITYVHAQAKI